MKTILKKFITALIAIVILLLINTVEVKAVLQSNTSTQYTKKDTIQNWVPNIRKMEATGGAMGLNETLNSNYTGKTSNNIDVHCIKTTEYGAIAILSMSGYGNPSNAQLITTTTGNNTGVILNTINDNFELTAGGSSDATRVSGLDSRYYDKYVATSNDRLGTVKRGDALECRGWHGAQLSGWPDESKWAFRRGGVGIFSYNDNFDSNYRYMAAARGVAVCGSGL